MDILPTRIYNLVNDAVNGDIENYTLVVHDPNKKGEGFVGEMCYVSLKEKNGNNSIHLAIKQAFAEEKLRTTFPIRRYYLNEIHFYTVVWPHFQKFQTDRSLARPFDNIAKCYGASSEDGHEKIVLENLRYKHFEIYDKKNPFDQEHTEFILKRYGKLHALSFAYKAIHPDEFREITKDLINFFVEIENLKFFEDHMKYVFEMALNALDSKKYSKVVEKYKPLSENLLKTFCDSNNYQGDYSVVLHGDCWSNNMMFKYNESKELCDMKFIDFQVSKLGTPVVDLSYFLYSGVPIEILNNLDDYLRVYHNSLTETLEEFGLDGNTYPFEALKREWKKYSLTGFVMGLILWRGKKTHDESAKDFKDMEGNDMAVFRETKFDEDGFKKLSGDLVLHMYENDFL